MAFSVLRSAVKCTRNASSWINAVPKMDQSRNLMGVCRCLTSTPSSIVRYHSHHPAEHHHHHKKVKKTRSYRSSESESDSDLEPSGHRGESHFWRRKIRTFHGILDVNNDGVVSYDDFKLLAERFIELGHLTEKHKDEFRKLLTDLWEKRWGPVTPYNLVTVEQFLEDMHHVINDKRLVRKAHSFLPYLFRALDKDQSGVISEDEFKLFFKCLGLEEKDASLAFRCMDDDNDGVVTKKEFVTHGREFFLTEDETSISKYFFGPLVEH